MNTSQRLLCFGNPVAPVLLNEIGIAHSPARPGKPCFRIEEAILWIGIVKHDFRLGPMNEAVLFNAAAQPGGIPTSIGILVRAVMMKPKQIPSVARLPDFRAGPGVLEFPAARRIGGVFRHRPGVAAIAAVRVTRVIVRRAVHAIDRTVVEGHDVLLRLHLAEVRIFQPDVSIG